MDDFKAPAFPEENAALAPARPSRETLELLANRRSTRAKDMTEPGPSRAERDTLLAIAARTPDHGKLFPWRFITFEGEARARFGELLEARMRETDPDGPPERYELERNRFMRAPLVIAVISDVIENHKIPEWEQELSAGAVCQNLLIAASAMGYGAQWLTEWYAYDRVVKTALGLAPGERVAGFIYVGSAAVDAVERKRKPPRVTAWGG